MVNQNKISSFKTKRQAKNVFPRDVQRAVGAGNVHTYNKGPTQPSLFTWSQFQYLKIYESPR